MHVTSVYMNYFDRQHSSTAFLLLVDGLLDQRMVDAPSINAFKSKLICIRDSRVGFFMD